MSSALRNVVMGFFGQVLDRSNIQKRWQRWRPSLSLLMQEDFLVNRFELLVLKKNRDQLDQIVEDMASVSPETEIRIHLLDIQDPWDFEQVFAELLRFGQDYAFDLESEQYFVHITTGTHVAQICLFLLTEAGYLPGRLLQSSPGRGPEAVKGVFQIIDLDLSKYDAIATRFKKDQEDARDFLKSGIPTRNLQFNRLIEEIEVVAIRSKAPILLMGPTGAGKSQLAKRIFELKRARRHMTGRLVEVNCATLHGDAAMSALFGHVRGAFTGALNDRPGLLRSANEGMVFLDEIGELGLDEQAMLLRALEEHQFLPVGSDRECHSDFQLIAGTNRDLYAEVRKGRFREDLLARINLWTFTMPGLSDRREDIEPNVHFELDRFAKDFGQTVHFNKEALAHYLRFAEGPEGEWRANFRDLNASVTRMATLASGHRIREADVEIELDRLRKSWRHPDPNQDLLAAYLSPDRIQALDLFDRIQLVEVLKRCEKCQSLAQAGRELFAVSRTKKARANDSDRLRKYLSRFHIPLDTLFPKEQQEA